jgi:hypothetical protein
MTEFEYLAVLVSIILGLGMTHLLLGVGRMIHRRADMHLDATHAMWTVSLFIVIVLQWWVFFQSQSREIWTFDLFLVVILWAVTFFLLAVVLFPPGLGNNESYPEVFAHNRHWFLAFWIASSLLDIALTALQGDVFDPPLYLPFLLHFVLLGLIGIFVKSHRYHFFLAAYVLAVSLAWAMLVRRILIA